MRLIVIQVGMLAFYENERREKQSESHLAAFVRQKVGTVRLAKLAMFLYTPIRGGTGDFRWKFAVV